MARPTDKEATAVEKIVCYTHGAQEKGAHHQEPRGEVPARVRRQRSRREMWARAFSVISPGRNWRDRVSRFRIG